ncbi:potassium channel family protein [Halomonas sp. NCCP-2165]|nr:potassium channel family protein [Halomonas sp. NCCP-2165]
MAHYHVAIITLVAVIVAVLLHYEAFVALTRLIERSHLSHRGRILLLVFGLLLTHVAEIWLFGLTAWWLVENQGIGTIVGYDGFVMLDYVFMSAVTYTTLGYGDIIPLGPIRFLYGSEALTGFMLITWSASFTFLEMQKHWRLEEKDRHRR